jgi:CheY-like chemotaxis protein
MVAATMVAKPGQPAHTGRTWGARGGADDGVTCRRSTDADRITVRSSDTKGHGAPRSRLDLLEAQLAAIEAWNAARAASDAAAQNVGLTREMRLDLSRRIEARRREHAAVLARAAEHLRASAAPLGSDAPVRAVIAHRSPWLREKVASRLCERGVAVVGEFDDGADAAGAMVVEQAELLLVEDRLPTLSGAEVVRHVRVFSPATVVGAHVLDSSGVAPLADAGARAVFTRRIPPVEIADLLVDCLDSDLQVITVV